MHITLRQLHIFNAAAQCGSFTRASEDLHLSQPAVSMQIKEMEDAAGTALFERSRKSVILTEAGRELHRYTRRIVQLIAEASQVMDELQGLKRGSLQVSVASTVSQYGTLAVAAFHRLYPGIEVSLDVTNRQTLLHRLENNEVDIVLMGFPPADKELPAQSFMNNPLVVIAAYDHHLRHRKTLRLREVADELWILREYGSGTRLAIEKYLASKHIKLEQTLIMNNNESIKLGVAAGLGVAIVSRHTIELELAAKRLRILPVRGLPIKRQWYVMYPKARRLSAAARAFWDFILSGEIEL